MKNKTLQKMSPSGEKLESHIAPDKNKIRVRHDKTLIKIINLKDRTKKCQSICNI